MTAQNPPIFLQAGSHPAEDVRREIHARLLLPRNSIVAAGDLAVSQNGTPNMSVNVAGGRAYLFGTEATYQGAYFVENRGTQNLAIAAADATNPRWDLVVAKVQDAAYSGGTNAWSLAVVTGTPAASPADPPTPANAYVLARVVVGAGVTSITNANITDRRVGAASGVMAAPGGELPCLSTARPTAGLFEGLKIYETDTDRTWIYSGSAWVYLYGGLPLNNWRITKSIQAIANATDTQITFDAEDFDLGANHTGSGATGVIPVAGDWIVGAGCHWASNTTGARRMSLKKNGATLEITDDQATGDTHQTMVTMWRFAAGDTLGLNVAQFAGGALNCLEIVLWAAKLA